MRWLMQVTRAPTRSQRASRAIVALPVIATTFVMHAMVGRQACQLKMPRPDAYRPDAYDQPNSNSYSGAETALGSLLNDGSRRPAAADRFPVWVAMESSP